MPTCMLAASAPWKGNYLKPHLDNSHDLNRERYRVLNLLYYITPDWQEAYGGNLELWDDGPRGQPSHDPQRLQPPCAYDNQSAVMASVSEVLHGGCRSCISNYYFSRISPEEQEYFHATSFKGRPGETVRNLIMSADNALRSTVLRTLGNKAYRPKHVYDRSRESNAEAKANTLASGVSGEI